MREHLELFFNCILIVLLIGLWFLPLFSLERLLRFFLSKSRVIEGNFVCKDVKPEDEFDYLWRLIQIHRSMGESTTKEILREEYFHNDFAIRTPLKDIAIRQIPIEEELLYNNGRHETIRIGQKASYSFLDLQNQTLITASDFSPFIDQNDRNSDRYLSVLKIKYGTPALLLKSKIILSKREDFKLSMLKRFAIAFVLSSIATYYLLNTVVPYIRASMAHMN